MSARRLAALLALLLLVAGAASSGAAVAATSGSGVRVDADAARAEARDVLDADRFRADRPREGGVISRGLDALGDLIDSVFDGIDGALPGGSPAAYAVVAALVLLAAALAASRLLDRPPPASAWEAAAPGRRAGADPGALERDAERAEREGDHGRAVRLRFAAGLLRLDAAGAIALRPSSTTGQVRRDLRSPAFDALADRFEAVAYGGATATAGDAADARAGWTALLAGSRRRAAVPAGAGA